MKLIVGLGNPGREYENTRHNIGFMVVDNFAKKNHIKIDKEKFNGLYVKTKIQGQDVILLKPQKYMNLSGEVVRQFVDYFKIQVNDLLIISDDLDMVIGKYKLRAKGSSGGHNGLKNIELNLNTQNYKRLKIGISNNKNIDTKDYVLARFDVEDYQLISKTIAITPEILNDYFKLSFDLLMTKYNHN